MIIWKKKKKNKQTLRAIRDRTSEVWNFNNIDKKMFEKYIKDIKYYNFIFKNVWVLQWFIKFKTKKKKITNKLYKY